VRPGIGEGGALEDAMVRLGACSIPKMMGLGGCTSATE
jgi:hypothetical protein